MGFSISRRSESSLVSVHPDLAQVLRQSLLLGVLDFIVIEGHRTEDRQEMLFRQRKTQVHWPKGKHNALPSLAVDIMPVVPTGVDVWSAAALVYWYSVAHVVLATAAFCGTRVRWGGDWDGDRDLTEERFRDLGHFELLERKGGIAP